MQDFITSYENCMSILGNEMKSFPWSDEHAYGDWLAQTYYFVSNSTRLLTLASSVTPIKDEELHRRYIDHAIEERGHEVMLLNDLKTLNKTINNYPELHTSAALYQSQYYWIGHNNPDAFFGYILMLEGLGAIHCKEVYQKVKESHGAKAGIFLKVHSEEDVEHVEKAIEQVEVFSIPTRQLVQKNLENSSMFYATMLKDIKEKCFQKREFQAA